jgi:transcriptional regulator with XRE-family HTH domain
MDEIGRKLLVIRQQRKLSLRQVEKLTRVLASQYGDKARSVSASWLGRIERGSHSIAHKRLESLKEVYGISHDELTDETLRENEAAEALHFHLPKVPTAVIKGLTGLGGLLLPPESWLAHFHETTLLPPPSHTNEPRTHQGGRRYARDRPPRYGVIGAHDRTLVPFLQPGAIVEIDTALRTIESGQVFHSMFERPVYFLRSHDGYHCGWCEIDSEENWLTLIPSAMTAVSYRRWRYRLEVEVVGVVNRILTRLGFPEKLRSSRQFNRR